MSHPEIIYFDSTDLSQDLGVGEEARAKSASAAEKLASATNKARDARARATESKNAVGKKTEYINQQNRKIKSLDTQKENSQKKIAGLSAQLAEARDALENANTLPAFTFGFTPQTLGVSSEEHDALQAKVTKLENALKNEKSHLVAIENNLTSAQNQLLVSQRELERLLVVQSEKNREAENSLVRQDKAQEKAQKANANNNRAQAPITEFVKYVEREGKPVEIPGSDAQKGASSPLV